MDGHLVESKKINTDLLPVRQDFAQSTLFSRIQIISVLRAAEITKDTGADADVEKLREISRLIESIKQDPPDEEDIFSVLFFNDRRIYTLGEIYKKISDDLIEYFAAQILFEDIENQIKNFEIERKLCIGLIRETVERETKRVKLNNYLKRIYFVADRAAEESKNAVTSFLEAFQPLEKFYPTEYISLIEKIRNQLPNADDDSVLSDTPQRFSLTIKSFRLSHMGENDQYKILDIDLAFLDKAAQLLCPCDQRGRLSAISLSSYPTELLGRKLSKLIENTYGIVCKETLRSAVSVFLDLIEYPSKQNVLVTTGSKYKFLSPRERNDREVHGKLREHMEKIDVCIKLRVRILESLLSVPRVC